MTQSTPQAWQAEYQRGGIPSSVRDKPSGSLVTVVEYLREQGVEHAGQALDLGSGAGRNSRYLASLGYHVTALDFTADVVAQFNDQLRTQALPITAQTHDLTTPWPIDSDSINFASDTFCYKHIIDPAGRQTYARELTRVLRDGGHYLITFAGTDDGYYSQFPAPELGEQVIVDPGNNIPSVLYEPERIQRAFPELELVLHVPQQGESEMHGQLYQRSTHLMLFRRIPEGD